MSQNESDNTDSVPGTTDLFDRLRQTQFNQEPVNQGKVNQKQSPPINDDKEMDVSAAPLSSKNEADFETAPAVENGKMPPEARRALVSLLKYGDRKSVV